MSRREKVHEVSSPISLFPFIGILLCTMGALLVILVAVSRSAKDAAHEQVAAGQQAASKQRTGEVTQKIAAVTQYVAKLSSVRGEGQQALNQEQRQLRNLDDHVRRLTEQYRSLELAAVELKALEEEHYDDRRQAEREVERLQQIVTESERAIAEQRSEEIKNKRSYALVPYEGPNGTFRRPIYLECRKGEVVLQPEGVALTKQDLRPPYGAGSPLAAMIRTARDHYVRLYPAEGQSRDTEPYPLLIVRPEGLALYRHAQSAIEAADFDFGIELAESDWALTFPTADAKLAEEAQLAVTQARLRQEVLAEAAPRAYRHPSLAESGEFEFEDEHDAFANGPAGLYVVRGKSGSGGGSGFGGGDGSGGGNGGAAGGGNGGGGGGDGFGGASGTGEDIVGDGGGDGSGVAGNGAEYGSGNAAGGEGGSGGGAGGLAAGGNGGASGGYGVASGGVPGAPAPSGTTAPGAGGAAGGQAGAAGGPSQSGSFTAGSSAAGGGSFSRPPEGGQHGAGMVGNSPEAGTGMQPDASGQSPSGVSMMAGAPPATASDPHGDRKQFAPRDRDWAIGRKPARAVPIQRNIRVVVRGDQLAILPENAQANGSPTADDVIKLPGDTVESIDQFVNRVRNRVEDWGLAGEGLYWRPVLVLNVGPDGQRRADDLARLLKNSGLELKADGLASKLPESDGHETR